MKTIHSINENTSGTRERIRVGLILAGIVTAVICALAMLYETQLINIETANSLRTPNIVTTDWPVKMINKIVASAIWPF